MNGTGAGARTEQWHGEDLASVHHLVQFYEDDEFLTAAVARFLGDGIPAGAPLLVISTEERGGALRRRLASQGVDTARVCDSGQLTFFDARGVLSRIMRDGAPDSGLFEREIGGPIAERAAASGPSRLRAYGEMVDLLWRDGQRKAAILLEELWIGLQRRHPFTLLCAYAMANFNKEPADLNQICVMHSHVVSGEDGGSTLRPTQLPHPYTQRLAEEICRREEVEATLRESLRELRAREEEIRRSEEQLRRNERQMQVITDALPVLISYVDADRRYQFVNAAYERWFGRPRAEAMGRHVKDLLGDEAYEVVRPHLDRALAGQIVTYDAELPYRDGGPRWVEATYIPHRGDGGEVLGYIALVADITERKRLERFRVATADRAERLLHITAAIADAVTAEQVFAAVVDQVAAAVGASTAALWLVDEDQKEARLVQSVGHTEATRQQFAAVPIDSGTPLPLLDAVRSGEPVWIHSQAELLRRYPHLRSAVTPGRSYWVSCLPIVTHRGVCGVLGLTVEGTRDLSGEEQDFLLLISRYASQALERLRLFEAEHRSRAEADAAAARLGVLSHASRVFVEADIDLDSRLRKVVAEMGGALGSAIGVSLIGADGRLHASCVYHPDPEAQALLDRLSADSPLQMGEGITGAVAVSGKSVLIPTIDPKEFAVRVAPGYRSFIERYPIYSVMSAPLRACGQIIGTMIATRTRPGQGYMGEDLRLFEELAERAAAAIENSRLYQENLDARSRAEQLYRFAQVVVSAKRVEQVFEAALDAIAGAQGTDRVAILMFGGDGVMRFRAWRGLSDGYRAAVEGHSPWPRDATAPAPILVPDVACDPAMTPYQALFRAERIGSLAFIPLVTRGRLLGKFMIYHGQPHAYSSHEVELASAIGNHLASVTARFAAIAKLEETIHFNELFAGVLAHDLRNPLAAMMSAAQLLLMRQEGETNRNTKPISRILQSGQRMTLMIEQLLDFTRARVGGGIEVHPREVNLADLCTQAIDEIELAHPEWEIQREVRGDHGGRWDPDRLLQVISNLVANAGQHGDPAAGIRVTLDGRRADLVSLEIRNQGAVPAALLPTLFDPFRGTQHRRDQSRGLGLGLFIVREIVRAHGGTVEVASSEETGTVFTVRLPRAMAV